MISFFILIKNEINRTSITLTHGGNRYAKG